MTATVEYAQSRLGEQAWREAMNPEQAAVELIANPYTYTDRERVPATPQPERQGPAATSTGE